VGSLLGQARQIDLWFQSRQVIIMSPTIFPLVINGVDIVPSTKSYDSLGLICRPNQDISANSDVYAVSTTKLLCTQAMGSCAESFIT
jgi:hypothetical protein